MSVNFTLELSGSTQVQNGCPSCFSLSLGGWTQESGSDWAEGMVCASKYKQICHRFMSVCAGILLRVL